MKKLLLIVYILLFVDLISAFSQINFQVLLKTDQNRNTIHFTIYGCKNVSIVYNTVVKPIPDTGNSNPCLYYEPVVGTDKIQLLTITGEFYRIEFRDNPNYATLYKILGLGKIISLKNAFQSCNYLEEICSLPSSINDLSGCFRGCDLSKLEELSNWDTSNVTDMSGLFSLAKNIPDISTWNTSSVINMSSMFNKTLNFNQNIGNWDTSKVTDMDYMFHEATNFNQDIGKWNTSNVKDFMFMFKNAKKFNADISNWDVSKATSYLGVFFGANNFNQDISKWNLNPNISYFDFLANTNLSVKNYDRFLKKLHQIGVQNKYIGCSGLKYHYAKQERDELTNAVNNNTIIDNGFLSSLSLHKPTSVNVTNIPIQSTPYTINANSFQYNDIDNNPFDGITLEYKLPNVLFWIDHNLNNTFDTGDQEIKVGDYVDFYYISENKVKYSYNDNLGPLFVFRVSDYYHNSDLYYWGKDPLILKYKTTSPNEIVKLILQNVTDGKIFWNNEDSDNLSSNTTNNLSYAFNNSGEHEVMIVGDVGNFQTTQENFYKDKLIEVVNFGNIGLTSLSYTFKNANALVKVAQLPSSVTTLISTFENINQTSIIGLSDWTTNNVSNMSFMFKNAKNFNQPLLTSGNKWNTSNVEYMESTFEGAESFNQDIGNWNVEKVILIQKMLENAYKFNQNIENWSLNSIQNISNILDNTALSIDNYDKFIISLSNNSLVNSNLTLGACNLYNSLLAKDARNKLKSKSWTLNDMGIPMILNYETTSNNQSINFQLETPTNIVINWGGNGIETINGNEYSYEYNSSGSYQIIISGNFSGFKNNCNQPFKNRLKEVISFGDVGLENLNNAFKDADCLTSVPKTLPSSIKSLDYCFSEIDQNNIINLDYWETQNVQSIQGMFYNAVNFNQELLPIVDIWNTSSITDFRLAFYGAKSFNHYIGNWKIDNASSMSDMLTNTALSVDNYNQTLIDWANYTNCPTNINLGAQNLYNSLLAKNARDKLKNKNWTLNDLGIPLTLKYLTSSDNEFIKLNLTGVNNGKILWDQINSVDLSVGNNEYTYQYSTAGYHTVIISGNISGFKNTPENEYKNKLVEVQCFGDIGLQTLENAFNDADALISVANIPSSVTSIDSCFANINQSEIIGLSNWETQNIQSMEGTFKNALNFNQTISNWNTSNVTNMSKIFMNAINFNQPLNTNGDKWNISKVTNLDSAFFNAKVFNQTISNWQTGNVISMNSLFQNAENFNQPLNTNGDKWNISNVTNLDYLFCNAKAFNQAISNWQTGNVTSMKSLFQNAENFNQPLNTNNDKWDIRKVTNLDSAFYNAKLFNQDISNWQTENLINMSCLFKDAINFNKPLNTNGNKWTISKVTKLDSVFYNAKSFNQNINNWQTNNVTCMASLFKNAENFNQPLNTDGEKWNICKVTNLNFAFYNAKAFNQTISNWETTNLISMIGLFQNAENFNQPLNTDGEKWNISKVTKLDSVFYNAKAFNQDISNWETHNITSMASIFKNAENFNQPLNTNGKKMEY